MDRPKTFSAQRATAVRTVGNGALQLLLPTARRERGELAAAARTRRVVLTMSIFRQPQNGLQAGRGARAGAAADAHFGHRSSLRQAAIEPSGAGPRSVSVSAARRCHRTAQSRLEHRYYVCSDARRLFVFGRGDGLVQPFCAQLGVIEHARNRFLFGRARRRVSLRPTANLQHGSGLAIYFRRFSRTAEKTRDRHQHGWQRHGRWTTFSSSGCGAA